MKFTFRDAVQLMPFSEMVMEKFVRYGILSPVSQKRVFRDFIMIF